MRPTRTSIPLDAARAAALAALAAHAARAQQPARDSAPAGGTRPGFAFAAVGLDPTPRYAPGPAVAGIGGYEYRLGRSRFGVRAAGEYWRAVRRYDAPDPFAAGGRLPARQYTTLTGGGVALTYRPSAAGGLRPYALAGVGYQQLSLRNEGDAVDAGQGASRTVVFDPPERRNSPAYTAGVGAAARAGVAELFAEARVTVLPSGGARGGRPIQSVVAPLAVGVRF